jgi:hypothetical protein
LIVVKYNSVNGLPRLSVNSDIDIFIKKKMRDWSLNEFSLKDNLYVS